MRYLREHNYVSSGAIGFGETENGAWCCDSYRMHWTCPDDELLEANRKLLNPLPDYGMWTLPVQQVIDLVVFARTIPDTKTAYGVALEEGGWVWRNGSGPTSVIYGVAPPTTCEESGINPEFLRDALTFCGMVNDNVRKPIWAEVTFRLNPEKMMWPWYFECDVRKALVMPVRLPDKGW